MDAAFPNRLRKCANDMRMGTGEKGAPFALELAADDIDALRELVVHCWIHSPGYPNCGYDQMTAEQKAFFDSITAVANEPKMPEPDWLDRLAWQILGRWIFGAKR